MPSTIPVRKLGAVGIIKDVNPFDLPPNAFSDGINVRFDNDKVSAVPVFRKVLTGTTGATPVFCYGVTPADGAFDYILYANADGRLFKAANGSDSEVSPVGFAPHSDPRQFTAASIGGTVYFNRPDAVPCYMTGASAQFVTLPAWDAGWRCKAFRSFGNFAFAIGMTEGATELPYRVRWGDKVIGEDPPPSWDETDTTKLAGYNDIPGLSSPLVDGGMLGSNFILYSLDDVVLVSLVGGANIFEWRRLPYENAGLLNANCWIEVAGKHYCWSESDIYVHDGIEKKSIIDGRNRETFFRELNKKMAGVFFVAHDKSLREILFCGISGNANASFKGTAYCNYAAVYNYISDTWSFRDLPNVTSATTANVNTVLTWDSIPATLTWDNVGGSWFDQEDSYGRFPVFTSVADSANGLTASKILVLDQADLGSLALARDDEAFRGGFAERRGLDLDEVGAELRGFKMARAIMPQVSLFRDGVQIDVQLGAHTVSASRIAWEPSKAFDPGVDYKINTRASGRYLAYRWTMPTPADFEASGYDLDVVITGKR